MRNHLLGIKQDVGIGSKYYHKWIGLIRDVLESLIVENGHCRFSWLPGAGGYYDQDAEIMNIWLLIKIVYMDCIQDEEFVRQIRKRRG